MFQGIAGGTGVRFDLNSNITLDSINCISIDPVVHGRIMMKHIDVRYHKLKEFVANKSCILVYVDTNRQTTDQMTKEVLHM